VHGAGWVLCTLSLWYLVVAGQRAGTGTRPYTGMVGLAMGWVSLRNWCVFRVRIGA
jgi:hypothetical protein